MIKFFRKIRQSLLSEGKTGKYFKYALGEIILVVVGILIALQINNWNTHRIERAKEDSYLINLQEDLDNQLQLIERSLMGEEQIYTNLTQAKNNFEKYKRFRPVKEDIVLLSSLNDRFTFTITSPSYTELLSTGNLDLITDKAFKSQMVKYYEDLEFTSQIIQNNNFYKDNVISRVTLTILETAGESQPGLNHEGYVPTFDNYQTPPEVMAIVESNLAKPENQLKLLNLVRERRLVSGSHVDKMKDAQKQTLALLELLDKLTTGK